MTADVFFDEVDRIYADVSLPQPPGPPRFDEGRERLVGAVVPPERLFPGAPAAGGDDPPQPGQPGPPPTPPFPPPPGVGPLYDALPGSPR